VGAVITRSPNSNIASAMQDSKLAISLFERMAPHSSRAKIALVGSFLMSGVKFDIQRLHCRASLSYEKRPPDIQPTFLQRFFQQSYFKHHPDRYF
jgi:hypothetical protein